MQVCNFLISVTHRKPLVGQGRSRVSDPDKIITHLRKPIAHLLFEVAQLSMQVLK